MQDYFETSFHTSTEGKLSLRFAYELFMHRLVVNGFYLWEKLVPTVSMYESDLIFCVGISLTASHYQGNSNHGCGCDREGFHL